LDCDFQQSFIDAGIHAGVISSEREAIQHQHRQHRRPDCFVAALLAMRSSQ
jgi:hypothetical protein